MACPSHWFTGIRRGYALTMAFLCLALGPFVVAQIQPEAKSWKAQHCQLLATAASEPQGPKVIVSDVVLDNATDVPESVWNQIASETKNQTFSGSDWVEELQEVTLQRGLQNQGYMRAEVSAEAKVVSSSPVLEYAVVHVRVRGGPQYKLSGIQFRSVNPKEQPAYSAEELRPLIPLKDGDIFSTEQLRKGLNALRKYYTSRGYLDFVASPALRFDDTQEQIALVFELDEGPQFRVGNIEVLGLDSGLENDLRSKLRSGDILNLQLIADFYQDHKSQLPEDALPEDTEFNANIRERAADVRFDFRNCAQLPQD